MRYWKRLDTDNTVNTVESYSHDLDIDGAIEIDSAEFNTYIASLPTPEPVYKRDLEAELDELKAEIAILKDK